VHAVLGPLALAWTRSIVRRDGEIALPHGVPISHGSGPDPDRILVLGSPVVQGVGVASYDLTFAGHLARQLAARTGRGADVVVRGIDGFDALKAAEAIADADVSRFDLILILGGVTEIVTMMPLSRYEENMRSLLSAITRHVPGQVPVLMVGVTPFMSDMAVPRFTIQWLEHRIARQNAVTRETCVESGAAEYVPFSPQRAGIQLGRDSSSVYESWATALVPYVDRALAAGTVAPPHPDDEAARQRALDQLGVVGSAPDAAVDRIVSMARDMLGVDAASLNFIDHERQWSKATAGIPSADLPRTDAICNTTIQKPGVYVVEDLDADPAFADSRWTAGDDHVRFYAGYPLEAPGGERVGALCVMAKRPRQFTQAETATLRDLALAAQAVLWENAG
jgi:hypothetical protein